jgi:fermentation-respiration switch protein FrsA (DUF1100 family)
VTSALRGLVVLIAVAGIAYWLVHAVGRRVLYPMPPRPDADVVLGPETEHVWLESAGVRSEAFFLAARAGHEGPTPLVIYAHGNGELIDLWLEPFAPLRDAGVAVLLVEYPGYGRSAGSPSQASITRAFVAAYDWAAARPDVDRARIAGWGRSLGGGVICALAQERPLARLVLESTFTSVRALASELFGLPGWLVAEPFDNLATVRAFAGPILLLHGEHDASIPIAHARALHEAALSAEWIALPCGHNDCAVPWERVVPFVLGR